VRITKLDVINTQKSSLLNYCLLYNIIVHIIYKIININDLKLLLKLLKFFLNMWNLKTKFYHHENQIILKNPSDVYGKKILLYL
jgi:hypothetical protein